jgi:hypothetical protein
MNQPTPWVGVTERIMIGVVMIWIVVLALALLRGQREQPEEAIGGKSIYE